jgi:hypothetical protein
LELVGNSEDLLHPQHPGKKMMLTYLFGEPPNKWSDVE